LQLKNNHKIIIISGPTASGKSQLALDFAQKNNAVIINADSLQIYAGLPILSSQPSDEEKNQVEHLLYSVLNPFENSSVAMWLKLVKSSVDDVLQKGKIPLIVGGSGMYISKLVEGISEIPETDEAIRTEASELFENLEKEDFAAELIRLGEDKNKVKNLDKHRLIRAYEVLRQTGKSIFFWQEKPLQKLFAQEDFLHINLNPNREELYRNCNLRLAQMLECGAIAEVDSLLNQGVTNDKQITKTLGFYEIEDFLNERITKEEILAIAAQKTRNYAKRQLTWFRNQLPEKFIFDDRKEAREFLQSFV
jgi:tRNA dimethylallyltransferase